MVDFIKDMGKSYFISPKIQRAPLLEDIVNVMYIDKNAVLIPLCTKLLFWSREHGPHNWEGICTLIFWSAYI